MPGPVSSDYACHHAEGGCNRSSGISRPADDHGALDGSRIKEAALLAAYRNIRLAQLRPTRGRTVCVRALFPGFSGHAERLSATACGQCDDCVPLRNLRCASIPPCEPDGCAGRLPGLCDRVAAARICPRVVGKRLYFRTFFSNSTEDYGPIDALWRFFAAGLYGCRRKVDLSSAPFWRRGVGNSGCPCG